MGTEVISIQNGGIPHLAAEVISIQSGCDSHGTGSNEYVMR